MGIFYRKGGPAAKGREKPFLVGRLINPTNAGRFLIMKIETSRRRLDMLGNWLLLCAVYLIITSTKQTVGADVAGVASLDTRTQQCFDCLKKKKNRQLFFACPDLKPVQSGQASV